MSTPLYQALTNQFYSWERRGRGWYLFDYPVDLEPPFEPFFYHARSQPKQYIDDGKRPTGLSWIADVFKDTPKPEPLEQEEDEDIELDPFPSSAHGPLYCLAVSLPVGRKVRPEEAEQLLFMLSSSSSPISFEIIATHKSIRIQFVCREKDLHHIQSQIKSYFPDCLIHDKTDELDEIIIQGHMTCIADFGLSEEFTRPIAMPKGFDLDPLIGLFGVLENLSEGEQGVVQILFSGAVNAWAESIMRSVMDNEGGAFFMDAPEMVPLAKDKISSPMFAVNVRAVGQSSNGDRAIGIVDNIVNAIMRISHSQVNMMIPLSNEGYDFDDHLSDILNRQSHRLGMLINCRELVTLVHLPSASVQSSKLERDTKKSKAAPSIAMGHDFILGTNFHQGQEKTISLSSSQRLKHTHVIGATGTGKSTFLLNCIVQDINLGHGLAVLDPHGDLIESILQWIPENRINDVILIDPADSEYPVGFNILTAHSEIEKDILSSDLVAVFRRLSTSWGDQMNSVFANAILAFLENEKGGTLFDLRRFLVEKSFRDNYLKTVTDPNITYYWQKEFPLLKTGSIAPILTRLDTFLRPKLVRNMVAQEKGINFEEILDGKILLVKLAQGLIGEENSYLLGTFFVSKMYQAAMARQAKSKTDRNDFFLYIDEFQNFITPSMSGILSGARKYHLGLILAHQDMQQLTKYDSELASSVIANAGTRICFRVGDTDAKKFENGFSFFEARDLQDLGLGEAIVRIDRPEYNFNLTTSPLPDRDSAIAEKIKDSVIRETREKYSTPKLEVQAFLSGMLGVTEKEPVEEIKKELTVKQEEIKVPEIVEPLPTQHKAAEIEASGTVENLVKQKEQSQHRYLQTLIKRTAESRGFIATIEEQTEFGNGRVDVSLQRNDFKIAVEISVTTESEWEVHNIEKCLSNNFDVVISCSSDSKTLEAIKRKAKQKLSDTNINKVRFFTPDELSEYLDDIVVKDASTEQRIKGYRVKVNYNSVSGNKMDRKKESIGKIVLDSIKDKK